MATCDPSIAAGVTKFGLTLFALLAEDPSAAVILCSPLSVSSALSLAAAGATSASAAERELLGALGVANHSQVAELATAFQSDASSGVTLRVANSVWAKQAVLPSFLEVARSTHGALAGQLGQSYDELNAWVSERTDGRIPKLIDPPVVDPLTIAVLVNAVYFLGSWSAAFDPRHTHDAPFRAPASLGGVVSAYFMERTGQMGYSAHVAPLGGAAVVRLDYGAKDEEAAWPEFCALLALPAEEGEAPMAAVVKGLQGTSPSALLGELFSTKVKLKLPRFKAEWGTAELIPTLRKLGVSQPFEGDGQFLQLSSEPTTYIAQVLHKATIEVTEEGTVATAATAAVMKMRSIPRPPPELTFDRPFVMLVLHAPTGVPLFVGRFNKPQFI